MNDIGNLPPTTADFLPQYKAIGQSLKKRFFRKPNLTEAIEQYESLCQELQREEQKTFAAVCCLEAAKCQENLKNFVSQANCLVKAGKLFLGAWESENHFTDESLGKSNAAHLSGNLELGIQTLSQAAKVFYSQGYRGLSIVISVKIGDILFRNEDYGEALNYYKSALVDAKQMFSFCDQLMMTELVCKAKVKIMEYESTLKTVNDTLIAIRNFESETEYPVELITLYAQKFEIMKVLLVLILGGNTADIISFIWPKLPATNIDQDEDSYNVTSPDLCESHADSSNKSELIFLLKSLVLAVQEGSTHEIKDVRNKLIPHMNETHHDLMQFLVKMQS